MSLILDMNRYALQAVPRHPVVRKRMVSPGVVVDGQWTDGLFVEETLDTIHVQESPGRLLLLLPEGLRSTETIVLYGPADSFREAVPATDASGTVEADLFVVRGKTYKVTQVHMRDDSGNYQRALAQKVTL